MESEILTKRFQDVFGTSFSGHTVCPKCGKLMINSRLRAVSRMDVYVFNVPFNQFECECGVIGLAKVIVEEIKK